MTAGLVQAQPANDAFANGQILGGNSGSVTGSNVNATKEAGEPYHAGDAGGHSVWYRWVAPASDPVTIDTIGSNFDTLLGVYNGSSVSSLSTIASNDDISGPNQPSRVSFTPTAGATYQIAVDGWNGAIGSITLNWVQRTSGPANDAFSNAQTLNGSAGSVTGNNTSATKEPGEPNHAGDAGGHSVWYRWVAPSSNPVTIDTIGSNFDTLLGVYTGGSVSSLSTIASNDDISGPNQPSRVSFTPAAGTAYQIAVDGWNGAIGSIKLNWTQPTSQGSPDLIIWGPSVSPKIETVTFSSTSCAVVEGMVQAGTRRLLRFATETRNQGTADLYLGNPATNPQFVWAPCHGHYHFNNYAKYRLFDSSGQPVATGLKVGFCLLDTIRWSPDAPSNAKYDCGNQGIQRGWGDLYDSSTDGQWIDVTGLSDGNYALELEVNPQRILAESNYANNLTRIPITIGVAPPANDAFINAQGLSGTSASVSGSNVNAAKEPGEPNHAGNAGGHSVWYSWTAPSRTLVVIDTVGSNFDTLLAVYTGDNVGALTAIAGNDDLSSASRQSRVAFAPVAGTTYQIAVDGKNGAAGNIVLTLNQSPGNDNFTNCEFIGGVNGTATSSNVSASKENGEPNHAGNPGGHSIWYCWTAPDSGNATFDTTGSTFDTLLAVYVGNSVNGLTEVASNDNVSSSNSRSRLTFHAVETTQYHIAIDGRSGATGNTTLNWVLERPFIIILGEESAANPPKESRPKISYRRLTGSEFELAISGLPLRRYSVEVSYDLVEWLPVAPTLTDSAGRAYFRDKTTVLAHREAAGRLAGVVLLRNDANDPLCRVSKPGSFTGTALADERRYYRAVEMP